MVGHSTKNTKIEYSHKRKPNSELWCEHEGSNRGGNNIKEDFLKRKIFCWLLKICVNYLELNLLILKLNFIPLKIDFSVYIRLSNKISYVMDPPKSAKINGWDIRKFSLNLGKIEEIKEGLRIIALYFVVKNATEKKVLKKISCCFD